MKCQLAFGAVLLASASLGGCRNDESSFSKVNEPFADENISGLVGSDNSNGGPDIPAVCGFDGDGGPGVDSRHGLEAKLKFFDRDPRKITSFTYTGLLADYIRYATPIAGTLYLNQLNVPVRSFDKGFSDLDGRMLTVRGTFETRAEILARRPAPANPAADTEADRNAYVASQVLNQYFSLHFDSVLTVSANEEGRYQLAVESDDGSRLYVVGTGGGAEQILIDNDAVHSVTRVAARRLLDLKVEHDVPFHLDYFQGPRYAIAMRLLWRKIEPNQSLSTVTTEFVPIPPKNLLLPGGRESPCHR